MWAFTQPPYKSWVLAESYNDTLHRHSGDCFVILGVESVTSHLWAQDFNLNLNHSYSESVYHRTIVHFFFIDKIRWHLGKCFACSRHSTTLPFLSVPSTVSKCCDSPFTQHVPFWGNPFKGSYESSFDSSFFCLLTFKSLLISPPSYPFPIFTR